MALSLKNIKLWKDDDMNESFHTPLSRQAWEYRLSGEFQKAIEAYTLLYAEEKDPGTLRGRGATHLQAGEYVAALEDFKQAAIQSNPQFRISGHSLMQGICFWYLNQPNEAINMWHQALTANYTDAGGGVIPPAILLYAGERLNDDRLKHEALQIFKKQWRNHQKRVTRRQTPGYKPTHEDFAHQGLFGWPGAVVPYLLGEINTEEFYTPAIKMDGNKTDRWRSQADFYLALRAYREGDKKTFQSGMTRCGQSQKGFIENEYFLAKWEVERNFPEPAFS